VGDQFNNISNLIGGSGNDTFYASNVANSFDGGAGSNTVNYARSGSTAVTVDLYHGTGTGGYAAGDTYTHIQNVVGSAGNDTFYANSDVNTFTGGGGTDTVSYLYRLAAPSSPAWCPAAAVVMPAATATSTSPT
jgi:Ca2+-binding RTX toxin-like protein